MTISLKDLLEVEKPLSELLQQNLPIKIAYHLGKLVKKVGSELNEFYAARDKMIMKLGEKDEEGNYSISPENTEAINEFQNQMSTLVNVEVDLYNFSPISIADFEGTNVSLTPLQMSALESFFTE